MDAKRFLFPHRAFPGIVRRRETATQRTLLFAQIGTDAGLRHAVNFYWNAKKITLAASGAATSRNYIDTSVYPDPAYWEASDMAWSWDKTYTQYAADAAASSLAPAPTVIESEMHPPITRIDSTTVYASEPIGDIYATVAASFTLLSTETRNETLRLGFVPSQIVWSTTHDRYALICAVEAVFTGSDTSRDYPDHHAISVAAELKPNGYTLGAGEALGDLALPDWLDSAGPFVFTGPAAYNPTTSEWEYPPASMALEVGVEFWSYPAT